MLRRLAHTIEIAEVSWGLMRRDGLMLFPLAMAGALLCVLLYVLVAFQYGGTFDRMSGTFNFMLADFILFGLAYLGAAFVVTYFGAALVSAAHYRMLGGTPDFRSGLEAANDRLGALAMWSAFSATVGLAFRPLCSAPGVAGRAAQYVTNVLGAWANCLVLPVMMAEGTAPPAALPRSSEMYLELWRPRDVARHSFGLLHAGHIVLTVALGGMAVIWGVAPAIVVTASALSVALAVAFLRCIEQMFIVAVYQYAAVGESAGDFPEAWLAEAFGYGRAPRAMPESAVRRRAAA